MTHVMLGDGDRVNLLVELAKALRLVRLEYLKPGEAASTLRLVEPYRLQESGGNLMVQCWQVDPEIIDRTKWRNFRLDRIVRIDDGGRTFTPRTPVTIAEGEVTPFEWGHDPVQSLGPAATYARFVETALLDGRLTAAELDHAQTLQAELGEPELRAIHGQILVNVLQEVLMDSSISDSEEQYIAKVRRFLKKLGWAP